MRFGSLALVSAFLCLASGCAPSYPDDRFVAVVRAMRPSVVLLTMRVPPARKTDRYDDGYGTGVVVATGPWGADILTDAHVVDDAWDLGATINNRVRVKVTMVAKDEDADVALVRTTRTGLVAAGLGSSSSLGDELGRDVALLGYPVPDDFEQDELGLATTISDGRLSSLRKDALEVTLPIVPGESGAPVFFADTGEIIGLADSRFDDEHSIGFAVPIDDAKAFLHRVDAGHGF